MVFFSAFSAALREPWSAFKRRNRGARRAAEGAEEKMPVTLSPLPII